MKQFATLLKAEFLEHKGGMFWLPAVIGALLITLTLVMGGTALKGRIQVPVDGQGVQVMTMGDLRARIDARVGAENTSDVLETVSIVATLLSAAPILLFAALSTYFILTSSLHSERADRSILFWKSMPVSDTKTVLAKFAGGTVLPLLIALAIAFVVYIVVLAVTTGVAVHWGLSDIFSLWSPRALFSAALAMVVFCFCYVLWAAPIYGWILLASAAAPRAPLLAAFLPPLVLGVLEGLFLRSGWLLEAIARRISGTYIGLEEMSPATLSNGRPSADLIIAEMLKAPIEMLSALASPSMALGLVVTALFLAGAIQLRRRKAL